MRKGRRCVLALAVIAVGVLIILALLLPGEFWWLLLAVALIALGIWMLRCC